MIRKAFTLFVICMFFGSLVSLDVLTADDAGDDGISCADRPSSDPCHSAVGPAQPIPSGTDCSKSENRDKDECVGMGGESTRAPTLDEILKGKGIDVQGSSVSGDPENGPITIKGGTVKIGGANIQL